MGDALNIPSSHETISRFDKEKDETAELYYSLKQPIRLR